jgi:hypothetical protein
VGTFNALPFRVLCVGAATAVALLGVIAGPASASNPVTAPFTECPAIGAAPSCDILLVVNPDNSVSVFGDSSVGPYDGGDDTLVGIVNNSTNPVPAITVSGPNSYLAGFDGDGICTYATGGTTGGSGPGFIGDSYCNAQQLTGTDPQDYQGPANTFTLDPNSQNDVEVDFAGKGLAANSSTYFSLEGALTAAVITARKGGLNQRYVALGDSVPYGHGLANPYPTSQIGLPATAVQQGPSNQAYPALVATALHLTLNTRSSNCTLGGDDLTISGANAATADVRSGNNQCPGWSDSESVERDELPAAQLAQSPATLVTIQAGADDIDFGACMAWELSKFGAFHVNGTQCVKKGAVTSQLATILANVRDALAKEIVQAAPHAKHVAVLNYYQIIPNPKDFKKTSITPGGQVDPVCWGLSHNLQGAYNDAIIIQSAVKVAITSAIVEAQADGVNNVQLIDLSNLEATHEICTGNPALFSGEPMPRSEFNNDLQVLLTCHLLFHSKSCSTTEPNAAADLARHSWRAAHPNTFGQEDIARAVESQLGNL